MAQLALSLRVACSYVANELGPFLQIAADDQVRRRRTGAVGLLIAAVAPVEACYHPRAALGLRSFGVDQGLHLVAPLLAFIGPADAAQIVQGTENFRKPLEVAIKRCGRNLGTRGRAGCEERNEGQQQDAWEHG